MAPKQRFRVVVPIKYTKGDATMVKWHTIGYAQRQGTVGAQKLAEVVASGRA